VINQFESYFDFEPNYVIFAKNLYIYIMMISNQY